MALAGAALLARFAATRTPNARPFLVRLALLDAASHFPDPKSKWHSSSKTRHIVD
jgi:hypothetical protein